MTAQLFEFPEPSPMRRKSRPKKKETKSAPYSEPFEAFWALYPRKLNCSKLKASEAWERLPEDMQAQTMAVLPIFGRQCAGKDEQYICHPATWLNQRRFETVQMPIQPQQTINIDWPSVLKIYARTNNWNQAFGPEPGEPNCKVPGEFLDD
jgi:hypothetical protein